MCKLKGCKLEAYHILKFSDYVSKRFDVNNGITLCVLCHNKTKRKENKYVDIFNKIIKLKKNEKTLLSRHGNNRINT